MPRSLPLYPSIPRAPIEGVDPRDADPACSTCADLLPEASPNPCVRPFPRRLGLGGVLVVVDGVTKEDGKKGRLDSAEVRQVAMYASKFTDLPVVVDAVVRCPTGGKMKPAAAGAVVANCLPYLVQTIADFCPTRIVCAGPVAAQAVLGRSVDLRSVRRGYGWVTDADWMPEVEMGDGRVVRPLPVYLVMPNRIGAVNTKARAWIASDFAWAVGGDVPPLPPWDAVYRVVRDGTDAREADAALRASGRAVVLDTETSGRMFSGELELVSVAACPAGTPDAWVWTREALADPEANDVLARLIEDPSVPKGAQNAKFDVQALREGLGVEWANLAFDTRIWRKQVDTDAAADLDTMGCLVGQGGGKDEVGALVKKAALAARKRAVAVREAFLQRNPSVQVPVGVKDTNEWLLANVAGRMTDDELRDVWRGYSPYTYVYGDVDPDVLHRYNAMDTVTTGYLADKFAPEIQAEGLRHGWDSLFGPATSAMSKVESWGFPVDRHRIDALGSLFQAQVSSIDKQFALYPGFNPASSRSVAGLLYDKLGLPVLKRTDGGQPSTDREALEALKGTHHVVDLLLEYRRVTKLKGTYVDGMIPHIMPDGRIHTTFNVDGARSGRMSSSDPNMHNIPSEERGEDGKLVKDCFVAPPGYLLLAADYRQLEFRVAADLSDDEAMREVFLSGQDFHQATAEFIAPIVWKITAAQVTKTHRRGAKAFNFGIMYGMQDGTIAARAGCSIDVAMRIRQAVMGKFRKFAAWIQRCLRETLRTGHAWAWWHGKPAHRRQLWHISDDDNGKRITAENSSYNTPVQGTASFYCMMSVVQLVDWILKRRVPAQVVATVHDSIVLLVRQDWLVRCARALRDVMMGHPTMTGVPLEVDMKAGQAWGSLQEAFTPEASAAYLLGGSTAAQRVLNDQLAQAVVPAW